MEQENKTGNLNIESLKEFETKRKNVETLKEELRKKKEEFEAANIGLINKIREESVLLEESKEEIKIMAVEDYNQSGEKKLLGGIGIRVGDSLIYEEKEAFDWAKQHQLCLQLDTKSFEKLAKSQDLEFVKKEEKVTVTFPKELKI